MPVFSAIVLPMKPNERIKDLLAKTSPTADVIQRAMEQEQAEHDELMVKRVRRQFAQAREILDDTVEHLRQARKTAKHAKQRVLIVDEAFRKFQATADFEAFVKAVNS